MSHKGSPYNIVYSPVWADVTHAAHTRRPPRLGTVEGISGQIRCQSLGSVLWVDPTDPEDNVLIVGLSLLTKMALTSRGSRLEQRQQSRVQLRQDSCPYLCRHGVA